ncbi:MULTISPECIES: hypothetical protein [Comamonas]|uniref:hypothetical protein n=1 Tax=Comamonas TaxID=283 RepID=UPI0015FD2CF0|nr:MULTISPECIES: hypothetical protein [Comamonas]UUC92075.1 hypothetical protein NOX35_17440 [Comamonas sp. C11]WEE76106.1 hypothetical protein LZ683_18320 [Comamonas testosteroni]
MGQRTYRVHGYSALVDALNALRQLPVNELIARVDVPAWVTWVSHLHEALRVLPTIWVVYKNERIEEIVIVRLPVG